MAGDTAHDPAREAVPADDPAPSTTAAQAPGARAPRARRAVLLRLDPAVHDALQKWAADDLHSVNAHIEILLRRALHDAGRTPRHAGPLPRRGRPPASRTGPAPDAPGQQADGRPAR